MAETIKYRLAENKDLADIKSLLSKADLPASDIDEGKIDFVVALNDKEELVGSIGLERYETDGLLRSLAVDQPYRNKKIGRELLYRLLSLGRQYGINHIHLLTTTAEKYFFSDGFAVASRNSASDSIKTTSEFSSICPSSSIYMVLQDIQKRESGFWKGSQIFKKDKESNSAYNAIKGENLMLTYFEVPPNTEFVAHKHESEQVTYVLDGEVFFEIENKTYRLTNGDSIIIPSNKIHRVWTNSKPTKAIDAWSPVNEKYTSR